MPGPGKPNSGQKEAYFYRDEVRALLLKLQEATRATPKGEPSLYVTVQWGDVAGSQASPSNSCRRAARGLTPCLRAVEM